MSGSLSLARISGLLFFASYSIYYTPLLVRNRAFPRPPGAIWWFAGYIIIYALNGFFVSDQLFYEFRSGLVTLVQLIVLFWCASDILRDEKIARSFLLTYSIACVILSMGVVLRVPGLVVVLGDDDRLTALGSNPNALAAAITLAAVILVGLSLNRVFIHKIILLVMTLPLLIVMVTTGSRGAVLAFVSGCLPYFAFFWKSKQKLAAIIIGLVCAASVTYLAVNNPMFSERVQRSYYEGSLGSREAIIPTAIEMILERPVFGWHPIEMWYELAIHTGWSGISDAHNLFLHLLLEVGLVGTIPFFVGLCLCGWATWKARSGSLGLVPVASFLAILTTNMSGTGLYNKELWLIFALGVAANFAASRKTFAVRYKGVPSRSPA